ncbi:hypothetical protein [Streptomyces flaveolus]|uniref:hypothetical protein n=1 Tax=Streptomyces flaveolus TaxID=67297 RepID=UPI0036FAD5D1
MANTGNTWDHECDVPAAGSAGGVFGHRAAAGHGGAGDRHAAGASGRRGTP